ncbi:hypothetical protein RZS08_61835, partial [Arthrospira platensis SPKY1]|nr:hypothetical protein [Arthrospira platensis SPKY1]
AVAPFLTSIENVNIRSLVDGSAISFANATGVERISFANSGANTAQATNVGAVSNFSVSNQTGDVTISGSTAKSVSLSFTDVGVLGDAPTQTVVTLNNNAL